MLIQMSAAAAAMALLAPQQFAAPEGGQQRVAPRGSYAQTCSGEYVNQGRLYADCQDTRGNLRGTSIELARCANSEIGNIDGLLVCGSFRGDYERGNGGGNNGGGGRPGGGGNNGGGWGGNNGGNNGGGWGGNGGNNGGGWGGGNNNGRDSVTVYRDANFRGQSQTFSGEIYNLGNSGFNDAISSMQFRGTWEACTDSNFRGQCQQFDGSVSNLDRWGLNDRISSIRPVRRGGGGW
ncbi:hypothetical protein KOAAANKH_01730 [Brevundimonas sp. NIBR10]|uniref:beta/gamma crystallin-related protein n=1 Tax=Brevundimonas sp. NIBR10 TaxID=3015997 RepID=UPI0022F1D59A|nr:beta/gamma crystallin-related protein [Brevundimonas sp. NIBR10]WGM46856.1 hypothetical protein KOAAANKH_01730 [Brevundimonas sp. NIBR10]